MGGRLTIAFGITVPKALGDFLVLGHCERPAARRSPSTDEDLLSDLGRRPGWRDVVLPGGRRGFASAARLLAAAGWLSESDEVVVLNTGAG